MRKITTEEIYLIPSPPPEKSAVEEDQKANWPVASSLRLSVFRLW